MRALKMHAEVKKDDLGAENVDAVRNGCSNLIKHIQNVESFGVPVTVSINHFITASDAKLKAAGMLPADKPLYPMVSAR